jgi:hypothetical protein
MAEQWEARVREAFQRAKRIAFQWAEPGEMVVGATEYLSVEHLVLVLVAEYQPRNLKVPALTLPRARKALGEFIPAHPVECWALGFAQSTAVRDVVQRAMDLARGEELVTVEHLWTALLEQQIPWLPAFLDRLGQLGGDFA